MSLPEQYISLVFEHVNRCHRFGPTVQQKKDADCVSFSRPDVFSSSRQFHWDPLADVDERSPQFGKISLNWEFLETHSVLKGLQNQHFLEAQMT